MTGKNHLWAWYQCGFCRSVRWLPTGWKWHTCEPCSTPAHGGHPAIIPQMVQIGLSGPEHFHRHSHRD